MRAIAFLKPVPCALHGKDNLPVSGKQTVEDKASCAHAGRRYHDIKICAMPIRNRARLWVRVIRPAKNGPGLALQSFSSDMQPGWTGSGAKGNPRFYALCVKTTFKRFTQRPQRERWIQCRLCGLFPGFMKPDFLTQYDLSLRAANLCVLCVKTTYGKGSRKDRKGQNTQRPQRGR